MELFLPLNIQEPLGQPSVSSVDPDSVEAVLTCHALNFLCIICGLITLLLATFLLACSTRAKAAKLEKTTDFRATDPSAVQEDITTRGDVSISTDNDDTLDESTLMTPSGTLSIIDISSFKSSTIGVGPSASSLALDSPVFHRIWKNNASVVATLAHKRTSRANTASAKEKLQRWASKRHEQAVQQVTATNQKIQSLPVVPVASGNRATDRTVVSPHSSEVRSPASAYVKVISPSAGRKLRIRRASIRAVARELEDIQATLSRPT